MAQRRMFSSQIVTSDAFLEMPLTSQALYFHLGMSADDDGFVSPRKILRMTGAGEDDLKVLVAKHFVALNRYRGRACGNCSDPNGALSPLIADLLHPMLLVV